MRIRRRTITWRAPGAALLGALGLVAALAAPASAGAIGAPESSYDRPGLSYGGGVHQLAWAGTDSAGELNVAYLNESTDKVYSGTHVVFSGTSTYQGTGAADAYSVNSPLGDAVVAWTDNSATVHVAEYYSGTLRCEGSGSSFGSSLDTPYLTFDTSGNLYVTMVRSGGAIHIAEVNSGQQSSCAVGGTSLAPTSTTSVTSDTTYVGPALVSLDSSSTLWLMWAGTNSAHTLNIAKFTPGSGTLTNKVTESSHYTVTDIGGTYDGAYPGIFFTYCGTDNAVYGQYFTGGSAGTQESLGGSCNIYTNSAGHINGGVAVDYDSDTGYLWYSYPHLTDLRLYFDSRITD